MNKNKIDFTKSNYNIGDYYYCWNNFLNKIEIVKIIEIINKYKFKIIWIHNPLLQPIIVSKFALYIRSNNCNNKNKYHIVNENNNSDNSSNYSYTNLQIFVDDDIKSEEYNNLFNNEWGYNIRQKINKKYTSTNKIKTVMSNIDNAIINNILESNNKKYKLCSWHDYETNIIYNGICEFILDKKNKRSLSHQKGDIIIYKYNIIDDDICIQPKLINLWDLRINNFKQEIFDIKSILINSLYNKKIIIHLKETIELYNKQFQKLLKSYNKIYIESVISNNCLYKRLKIYNYNCTKEINDIKVKYNKQIDEIKKINNEKINQLKQEYENKIILLKKNNNKINALK